MEGRLGSMEGVWNGHIQETSIKLCRCSEKELAIKEAFRPYMLCVDNHEVGYVFQSRCKMGLFKSYGYHKLVLNEKTYDLFPIEFGKEGSKNPIFCEEQQTALVEKSSVIYNDLHEYRITAINKDESFISILFCCYTFVNACYRPGEKVSKSYEEVFSTTTNKFLKAKYNSDFISNMKDSI